MTLHAPDHVVALSEAIRAEGGRALLVGGWVRDALLSQDTGCSSSTPGVLDTSKDVDLEVFGLDVARLRAVLDRHGRVDTVGESFTVFKIGNVDVALPRRESKVGRGHKGFLVEGDPDLPIEEAARRRDFTINAIAYDPLTDEVLDPFGGRQDLDARLLKAVDATTFVDDSLRVLRALQFTARFGLSVNPSTFELCRSIALDDLPSERIWSEFEKLLLLAERPSIGLALAMDLGVVAKLLPELLPLTTCPQDPEWHPEGDVWTHTLMVVDEARKRVDGLERGPAVSMMLAAICHDIAKPQTTAVIEGRLRSPGHEEAGVEPATSLLDRLNVHTLDGYDVRRAVLGLVAQHLKPSAFWKAVPPVSDGAFRRLAQKVDLELLALFAQADCHGRGGPFDCTAMTWFVDRARALGVQHQPPSRLVLGRHLLELGVAPGPRMGTILNKLYEQQLDGEIQTLEQGLAAAAVLLTTDPLPPLDL